ncbi:Clavaminate synthase-like protein, partial [Ascodesmis nigricans]
TTMANRKIPKISLHDFASRRAEIGRQIISAAENDGFFVLYNQASPSVSEIEEIFKYSKSFFALPHSEKSQTPHVPQLNTGWEHRSQIRPSTGVPDQKESLQLQLHRLHLNWPSSPSLPPDWAQKVATFALNTHNLSMQILSFFACALGFPEDFFTQAHQLGHEDAQSTLRLLHYFNAAGNEGEVSAGAHTDFDCLTMLFQRSGESGLEICPGREAESCGMLREERWTPVEPKTGEIVCNIGDMLMAWSDDRFKSLFHRVAPVRGERFSIAWFNQANKNVIIQGPLGKYPVKTAERYLGEKLAENFRIAKERSEKMAMAAPAS